jgi:uncharacterized membrane protein
MSQECVVAVYDSFEKAKGGIQALDQAHFPENQVSFVAHNMHSVVPKEQEEALQFGDQTEINAAKGAGLGGLVGILISAPIATIAGVGAVLIAGPIAMGLAGAIVGGFMGAMSGWGVHRDHVRRYENKVAEGSLLVIANGNPREVAEAEKILLESDADEVYMHAETSADTVDP